MVVTREDVIPTLIPNTTMKKSFRDGVAHKYEITPVQGYVLHDKAADWYECDEDTGEELYLFKMRYSTGECSCNADYDFTPVTVTDENGNSFTAYGSEREFFTRPSTEVPTDSTYGIINKPETV